MRFPPSLLDDIRNRLPASRVVGRKVTLKKQGREYAGLSPFNKEKTPSFFVNDDKQFYHCFSSGKHGDIFTFLMETEGISFPEAVERLADEAGVSLPKPDPKAEAQERRRASLTDVMEDACAFFEAELFADQGARARDYLRGRGIDGKIAKRFRLGFAPAARAALKTHLAGRDVTPDQMLEVGLVIGGEDIAVPYDRFRDRVMFPITDPRGRVIAFGGRGLDPDAKPKYMNSPETPLFHKGHTLFNIKAARGAAHNTGRVIVVEGYMDVIALARAGIDDAVAPLGTALTEGQLDLLWRMADEPILCFDGDSAGLRAAHRAMELALPRLQPGRSLRFALLPPGQDPDDLYAAGGRAALDQVLGEPLPLSEMLWRSELEAEPITTPERRAAFESRIKAKARAIGDADVRRHYERDVQERLSMLFGRGKGANAGRPGGRMDQRRRLQGPRGPRRDYLSDQPATDALRRSSLVTGRASAPSRRECVLVATLINHPSLLGDRVDMLSSVPMAPELMALLDAASALAARAPKGLAEDLRRQLSDRGHGPVLDQLDRMHITEIEWFAAADASPGDAETGFDHTLALHRKISTLHTELAEVEDLLARETTDAHYQRLRDILSELERAEGSEAIVEGFGASSGRAMRVL
ncbi:MAG: DNA primase [Pseudomonadota bacterium]